MAAMAPPLFNTGAFSLLPYDITVNILTMLSAKVLCKLRCVSKSFAAVISDPYLIQSHSSRANPPAVVILSKYPNYMIRILDTGEEEGDGNVAKEFCTFLRKPYVFHARLSLWCIVDFMGRTFVLNPATEQRTLVPRSNNNSSNRSRAILGFGQVASTGEYKIVSIFYNDDCSSQICEVFTLGRLESEEWRVAQPPPLRLPFMGASYFVWSWSSALVNGNIYALSRLFQGNTVHGIVCFNLEREEWRVLTGPPPGMHLGLGFSSEVKLIEFNGFLCLAHDKGRTFDMWFFNKNGDGKWAKEYAINYSSMLHHSCRVSSPNCNCNVCPRGLMADGRILLQNHSQLFLYDPKQEQVTTLVKSYEITSTSLYTSILSLTSS